MLASLKIKEEPLDEIEDLQEIFKQEEDVLMKQQINEEADLLPANLPANNFHIVEERDSFITVSAADMKSEDELQFIDSINNADPQKFKGVCSKCLKCFTNRSQFLKHTKRNHCITKQKCPVCPVTFIDAPSLLNHLNLHRDNTFFCSLHCGANFATLPLCEDHELKEHKVQATPKIRYKHFCSFCREGFKTELQLHVHWLQQSQGCGKLMQDVVLHSTNVANNYNTTNCKKSKNLTLDTQLSTTNNNTNPVTIIPITKLRLKSLTPAAKPTNTAATIKRPFADKQPQLEDNEIGLKKLKLIDEIKTEVECQEMPFNFQPDIPIKEEPLDEYETDITANLIPEVIIKTEEEEENPKQNPQASNDKPKMQSLIINNIIGPESSGKFIPLENFVSSENTKIEGKPEMKTFTINNLPKANVNGKMINMNNNNLPVLKLINNNNNNINLNNINKTPIKTEGNLRFVKILPKTLATAGAVSKTLTNLNLSNLKSYSTGKLMTLKLANGQNLLHKGDIKPLPTTGLQIIKFLPNTQFLSLKNNNNNNKPLLNTSNKPPIVLKLKTPPTLVVNKNTDTKACSIPTNSHNNSKPNTTTSPTVSIKLNSLEQNTTIDAEDFKKLQAEALIKAEEHRKNLYIPKNRLMIIENIPEKKQLIDSMKQQIAEVQTKTTEQIQGKPAGNFILKSKDSDEPRSLYLPILTTLDVSLVEARYQNPNYCYKWICPYCLKDYEIKTALKVHLNRAHNLNNRDMEKINVQAKPFVCEEQQPIEEDIKPQIKEEIKTKIKIEPILTQDTDSQSFSNSESESLIIDTSSSLSIKPQSLATNIKLPRPRYVCDKCGRTCSSKTMLNDHILANCSREPQYSCKECNKKFYSHGTLQCHMTIHTGELPHKCNYCEKRFRTRGQVKVHHRTHTGERPFFCQVCSQRFTHRETLIAHLSRHIGMKRYKCYGCDKHFSCISALKTHREIRADTCGKVKFNPRAIGPRVRVIRGNVIFEPQPEINPYLKSEDPKSVLSELQNQSATAAQETSS
ncbi:uncharacterized protein LOC111688198 isoform X1 [Lucilia cuprina]|uniref:uncharacterized protein LOC111688198 isoform X1 n=2 Tax=Lucilia cuprina TaxID=7375 RepID=UPI001F06E7F2|nr:uncharacterized protein LOC111688198 isoform X1 [Lucilia cuprina]